MSCNSWSDCVLMVCGNTRSLSFSRSDHCSAPYSHDHFTHKPLLISPAPPRLLSDSRSKSLRFHAVWSTIKSSSDTWPRLSLPLRCILCADGVQSGETEREWQAEWVRLIGRLWLQSAWGDSSVQSTSIDVSSCFWGVTINPTALWVTNSLQSFICSWALSSYMLLMQIQF